MTCAACHAENPAGMKFCGNCGSPLRQARVESQAERRQLTVFFIDLVGSTALSEHLDPEELRDLYAAYQETCGDIIRRYGGHIAQYLGDGMLAYFGYPTAHEDNGPRAVRSGLEILDKVREISLQGQRLHVRIGVHTGLVVVGDVGTGQTREQLALGEAPNIAARIQSEAEPDTMLISDATRQLLGEQFELTDLGERALRGISKPIRMSRVTGERKNRSRFEAMSTKTAATFVGRQGELDAIRDVWRRAAGGAGQTLSLRGEPGIGKSRLVGAAKRIAAERPHELFEAQCSPYQANSALYPMLEMLGRRLGLERLPSNGDKLSVIEAFARQRRLDPTEVIPLLASLFAIPVEHDATDPDMPPARRRQLTLEILVDLLLRSPDGRPVLVVVEDIHWADPSTLDLLGLLVTKQTSSPALVLCTTRPEGAVPGGPVEHRTELLVEALPHDAARALVSSVVGKPLPEEVMRQILARTGGVPLFVEAVVRTVVDSGVLRELDDRYELTGPLPPGLIPATIHDSLMARIDRLGVDKPIAQIASTIGREFGFDLLLAVSEQSVDDLSAALRRLVELDLVSQAGEPPLATYTFKHALIQDAAYESLLRRTRQESHGRIADALLARFPETAETRPELLARHFEGAARIKESIAYWMKAGFQAQQRSAVAECVAHMRKAISLLETFPQDDAERIQQEMDAQLALGPALMATRGWGSREVEVACQRARELCEKTGNGQGLFTALWGLWTVPFVRGQMDDALVAAERVMQLAMMTDVKMLHATAQYAVGFTHYFRGEFDKTISISLQQLAIFDFEAERAMARMIQISPTVVLRSALTMALQLSGFPDQAKQRQRELVELYEALANPAVTGVGYGVAMYYYLDTRNVQASSEAAERAYALSSEAGFEFWASTMQIYKGWVRGMLGERAAGIAEMRSGLARFMATESGIYVPTHRYLIADILRLDGQVDEALESIRLALEQIDRLGERYYESQLLRLTGEVHIQAGSPEAAETALRRAIEVAQRQEARLLEIRATNVLARLLHGQRRNDEASALLQPLYDSFTEGFGAPELIDARAILASLQGVPATR